jgi:hypothetical protein
MSPRQCTICVHPGRAKIEEAIAARVPYRRISERHGVSISAISRHLKNHVAEELLEILQKRAEAHREIEMAAFFGPELVEWMRDEEAALAETLAMIDQLEWPQMEWPQRMEGEDEDDDHTRDSAAQADGEGRHRLLPPGRADGHGSIADVNVR